MAKYIEFLWFYPYFLLANAVAQLPSTCQPETSSYLDCSSAYIFPETFDVDSIPGHIQQLKIGMEGGYSVLNENYIQIPLRAQIERVILKFILHRNGKTFPLNQFLVNIKHQLLFLEVSKCPLHSLDSKVFQGFSRLQNLILDNNHLQNIHRNTFAELLPILGDTPTPLRYIIIRHNFIEQLDWAAFSPLASSLIVSLLEYIFGLVIQRQKLRTEDLGPKHLGKFGIGRMLVEQQRRISIPNRPDAHKSFTVVEGHNYQRSRVPCCLCHPIS